VIVALLVIVCFMPSQCSAADYVYSYWLLDHPDGSTRYRLTVSATSSLYEYYSSQSHSLRLFEFAKFVTPNAVEPIADSLWSIYDDEEDFANGALMILHQIPYVESDPQYPVETIVQNQGDCDTFSYVAASILIAGGLDVVLLYYESMSHMNVGVHLAQPPQDARSSVYYYSVNGRRYYVAECTGNNWQEGWRVGESPEEFEGVLAQTITLEDCEQLSPGQVTASYSTPASSTLSLALSKTFLVQSGTLTISGTITPIRAHSNVTIYVRWLGSSWSVLHNALTDANGRYSYVWAPNSSGLYYVRTSWSGDAEYTGADSTVATLTVIAWHWLLLGLGALGLIIIAIVAVVLTRNARTEPQPNLEDFDF
jgi:hypothetical protein